MLAIAGGVWATPVLVTPFGPRDYSTFSASVWTSALNPTYGDGVDFGGTFMSQVFRLPDQTYLYIYQARNAGPSELARFNLMPFSSYIEAGYLTDAGAPAGFLPTDGKKPFQPSPWVYDVTYDAALAKPLLAYQFAGGESTGVAPGKHTAALYVISRDAPTLGEANMIDGGVSTVDAWVPVVPDPSTVLALLSGLGALAGLKIRKRR